MGESSIVFNTLKISVLIQLLSGIYQIIPLFMKFSIKRLLLVHLLYLDLAVQVIEFAFYAWWMFSYKQVKNITSLRYIDWAITTPTMLFTLIIYVLYINNKTYNYGLYDTFIDNYRTIGTVLILNWAMLYLGYMGEIGSLDVPLSVTLGFVPFIIYFYLIYNKYIVDSNYAGKTIFYYFLIVWSIYGVAAMFSYNIKNSLYNILDIFAKNFFGIYIAYLLLFTQGG